MLFVRRVDMSNTVLSKNNIVMKRNGWIVAIGLLFVIFVFFYFRFSNTDSSKEKIVDSLKIVDSSKKSESPSDEKFSKDSSIGIEGNSNTNKNNEIEKSALTSTDNKSSKRNSDTLSLRDFGVVGNGKNETIGFQKALNASVGKVLFIPKQQGKYYLTRQLFIPSNSKLVFDSNVIIQATDDLKQSHADFEALIRIENVDNVNIHANKAVFRMNKSAYASEHNHIFMINGASNVTIKNAKANNSGGDGFYIGAYKSNKAYCENIKILSSSANNNRRQGLSIVTGKNILIDGCSFNSSAGTDPESGLDIEPSKATDILQNIKVRNSTMSNNKKRGMMILLNRLNAKSAPVSIIIENCKTDGNLEGFSNRRFSGVQGEIQLLNCIAKNSKYSGFTESSCLASSIKKIYKNCVAENSNTMSKKMSNLNYKAGFYLFGDSKGNDAIGNSEFIDCKTISSTPKMFAKSATKRSTIDYEFAVENGNSKIKNIKINNFKTNGVSDASRIYAPQKDQLNIR